MNVVERELTHLGNERALKIVSVQLVSPFTTGEMEAHKFHKWISWKTSEAEKKRRQKVEAVLDTLRSRDHDVLVFPEYSVPESLHETDIFQRYADAKNCIVIPGTFCPTSATSLFAEYARSNIGIIYIPRQERLIISKNELHPDEVDFVKSQPDLANCARLIWPIPDGPQASINIFICRDYLKPFRQLLGAPKLQMISELDWMREGLNIVLMESKESNVFLGRAAAEIRRLRGPGKIVLFANSASNGSELATALIGPAPDRKIEFGDVVECVPAESEGILSSDVSLSGVEYTVVRPDRIIRSPIQNTKIDLLAIENNVAQLKPLTRHGPRLRRGIWHPALLATLERKIIFDLYQTRKIGPIRETFKRRISSVYAAIIRGFDDVMIRRYDKNTGRHLGYPFSNMTEEEQIAIFGTHTASIYVEPESILKYRGNKFDPSSWRSERRKMNDLLEDERYQEERIDAIAALAEDWDSSQIENSVRDGISVAFNNRVEITIPLDQDVQNGIFETYVLMGVADQHDQRSFKEFLIGKLLDDDNVREVFHPIATSLPFQYLIKLKCTTGKTDQIILNIREEAEQHNFMMGTRIFGVVEYLQKESVIGLANTNVTPEVKLLMERLRLADAQASLRLDLRPQTEQFLQIAKIYAAQRLSAVRVSEELYEDLTAFYCNLYFGNFTPKDTNRQRRRYLQYAHNSFANMFQHVEREAETKMTAAFAVQGRREIAAIVGQRHPKIIEEKSQNDPLELMLKLPVLFVGNAVEEQFRRARSLRQAVTAFRNLASHGSAQQYNYLDISSQDWQVKWQAISTSTSGLLEMASIVYAARLSKKPKEES